MKEGRKRSRLIAMVLVLVLLSGTVCALWMRPDWRFLIESALRWKPPLDLKPILLGADCSFLTLSDLRRLPNVTETASLMLVNAAHPLPNDYVPTLREYNGTKMHPDMIAAYAALRDEVEARTGMRIYVSADYRTKEEQETLLQEGEAGTVAPVGCSEHEAGLALDVYVKGYGGSAFLKTEAGCEVNRICGEYGFIVRYPSGKEDVTGISYEPWHLRYVGQPHARLMMESGLTYEEYLDALSPEVWYESGEYRILKTGWECVALPNGWKSCHLSKDNAGHTVITLKMS